MKIVQQLEFVVTFHTELLVKRVLNPNFRPFSFELKKIRFFEINFGLGFRVM